VLHSEASISFLGTRIGFIVLLATIGLGCAGSPSGVITYAEREGLSITYQETFLLRHSREDVLKAFEQLLESNDCVVTAYDERSGFIAWCDLGHSFHALHIPESPVTGTAGDTRLVLLKKPPSHFHGIVYGAARFRDLRGGTSLHLHATWRDERSWITACSNGDYERGLYRRLFSILFDMADDHE